jgi:hypothetical protein
MNWHWLTSMFTVFWKPIVSVVLITHDNDVL